MPDVVLLRPLVFLLFVGRRVRRQHKVRLLTVALVADRTAHLVDRVRRVGRNVQIEIGMRQQRMPVLDRSSSGRLQILVQYAAEFPEVLVLLLLRHFEIGQIRRLGRVAPRCRRHFHFERLLPAPDPLGVDDFQPVLQLLREAVARHVRIVDADVTRRAAVRCVRIDEIEINSHIRQYNLLDLFAPRSALRRGKIHPGNIQ